MPWACKLGPMRTLFVIAALAFLAGCPPHPSTAIHSARAELRAP